MNDTNDRKKRQPIAAIIESRDGLKAQRQFLLAKLRDIDGQLADIEHALHLARYRQRIATAKAKRSHRKPMPAWLAEVAS